MVAAGKEFEDKTVERVTAEARRERKEHEKLSAEAGVRLRDLETQINRLNADALDKNQSREAMKEAVKSAMIS